MAGDAPTLLGVPMKHVSLITLTFQNSALILILHYSRIMPLVAGHRYFASTAVLLNEIFKLMISLTIVMYEISQTLPPSTPISTLFEQLYNSILSRDGWQLAIPATLYTLQNSLQYVAVSNLDAVHFQILYQLKILTTALFSVSMLGRVLSTRKWFALVLLTVGVIIVQLPADSSSKYTALADNENQLSFPRSFHELGQLTNGVAEAAEELTKRSIASLTDRLLKRSATYEGIHLDLGLTKPVMNYSIGLSAVLIAATISGLNGVYFEKVLKNSTQHVTVWTRNVQLSLYSLFPALIIGVLLKDGEEIAKNGFFSGYNGVVWTTIIFQALGGVLVSLCINYADNIAKNFATSISIILSFLFSVWFFDFHVTFTFALGTTLVIFATYVYNLTDNNGQQWPSSIKLAKYESTTIDGAYLASTKQDRSSAQTSASVDFLENVKSIGSSTSRPSSPSRQHSRAATSKGKLKRGD